MGEGEHGQVDVEPVGREGVLAIVGGVRLVTGKLRTEDDIKVAIGGVGHLHLITPGPRLEDAFGAMTGAGELLVRELRRAQGWLAVDEPLGLVALCGPLSRRVYRGPTQYRREAGYLDGEYGLTQSGWWRLAYGSGQGVGFQEKDRAVRLKRASEYRGDGPARGNHRMHTRRTQKLVLKLYKEEGLVPLGVEYSELGRYLGKELGMRADALMVNRDGSKLLWIEYQRKKENDYLLERQGQFEAKRAKMVEVANVLARPVEFYAVHPNGLERWAQVPTGEWAPTVMPADLWATSRAEAEAPGYPSPGVEDEVVGLLLSAWKGDEQGIVVPVKRLQAALQLVEPKPDRAVRQIFEVVKRCHILWLDGGVVDSGVRDANMALAANKMGVLYLRRALSLLSDAQSSVRSGNDIGNVLQLVFAELAAGGGSSPREQGASGIGLGQLPTVAQAPPLAAAGPVLDPAARAADESAVAAAPAEPPRASPGEWLDGERDDEAEQKLEREWWLIQRRVENKGHALQSLQFAHSRGFTVRGRVVMIWAQSAAVADQLRNWKQQVILDEEIRRVVGRSFRVRFAFDPQGTAPKVDAPEDSGHYN